MDSRTVGIAIGKAYNKLSKKPITENFGRKEIRAIEDMTVQIDDQDDRQDAWMEVNRFIDWCETYEGR